MSADDTSRPVPSWSDLSPECREALERLFEFLDHELPEVDEDRIRQHLADCEACLADYDLEDHVKKLVRRSCSEHAPPELHTRIRQQITVLRARLNG